MRRTTSLERLRYQWVWGLGLAMVAGGCAASGEKNTDGPVSRGDRRARMRERMMKDDGAPKVGELAPTFALKKLEGEGEVKLANVSAERPVVLFFGSYT